MTSNNPSVEEILETIKPQYDIDGFYFDQRRYKGVPPKALKALAQREEALLTYIADMYGLPKSEVLKTAEMWRGK